MNLEKCRVDHPDCHAREGAFCRALQSTKWPEGKDCPFYKSREQVERENDVRLLRRLKEEEK